MCQIKIYHIAMNSSFCGNHFFLMSNMNCLTHKPPPVFSLFPKNVGCSQGSFLRFKSSKLVSMLIIWLKPEKKVVDFLHGCLRLIVSAHGSWLVLIGAYGCQQIIMALGTCWFCPKMILPTFWL